MKDIHGNPLPPLSSVSTAAERYLAAILAELQWQRAQNAPPPEPAQPVKTARLNKVEEIRGRKAA
jgi:hypothetical protein